MISVLGRLSDDVQSHVSIPPTSKAPRRAPNYTVWFVLMNFLLMCSLAINAIQFVFTYQQNQVAATRAASYQERVQAAQGLVERQRDLVLDLVNKYQKDAYDNPSVERIAEQQLIATEYTLIALQIIAIQNSQIIELLAYAP